VKLKTITPPAERPLSLAEARKALKIDDDSNDDEVDSLVTQAVEYCEGYQNRKFVTQTLEVYLDSFPNGSIKFTDCSPVQSIESIKFIDFEGTEHTFDSSNYSLDDVSFVHKIDLAYGKSWPSAILKPTNGVKIQFVAGYGDATAVPETVKWAMILHMKLLYDDYKPDERDRMERARDSLLSLDRVVPV
jgi:uncharacterized phiE125 gp8 family phage protein